MDQMAKVRACAPRVGAAIACAPRVGAAIACAPRVGAAIACALIALVVGCGGSGADEEAQRRRSAATARHERELARGREIFDRHCLSCHTIEGRRFTKPVIEWEAPNLDEVRLKRHYVEWRVAYGGPAMASFGSEIPEDGIRALVTYVTEVAGRDVDDGDPPADQLERGREVFAANCARCHGIEGKEMTGRPVYPGMDFNLVKPSERLIRRSVRRGISPDTIMPAFGRALADDEIAAVAAYVNAVAAEGPEAPRTPFEDNYGLE